MHLKPIPFHERAFPIGTIIGVNAYRVNRILLKQRIVAGGYTLHETPHFLLGRQAGAPTLVVHWFPPQAIDADLGQYFIEELKPLGMLGNPQHFGDVFGAVVGSVFPKDPQRAWHLFGMNTLQRYHDLLITEVPSPSHYDSPVDVFASLYRRVCELHVGESLLDAGCSFGFLPLVVAERIPILKKVLGVDIRADAFSVTGAMAEERHLANVQFAQADLLADNFSSIGCFDTVTVLHVLEHFTEKDMYRVLTHLLEVTSQRLIIAVPYELGEPETAYGHEQLFTPSKLEAVGRWYLDQLGTGWMTCKEWAGGLLIINKCASS